MHILFLGCLVVMGLNSVAQNYPLKFNHISYKEGLSQSPIGAIFQDKKGFIWIGNREGLTRYDGYEFVSYSHKEGDHNSLSHNLIRSITQDSTGMLWVGTSNGLNVFDPVTEKFTYIDISQSKTVSAVLIDKQQYAWVASYDGLKRVRRKSSGKLEVLHIENDDLRNGLARALMQDQEGRIWIGFTNGIRCLDPSTLKIVPLPDAIRKEQDDRALTISSIREDKRGDIWFSTEGDGFFWYKKRQGTFHNFRNVVNLDTGLPSNVIKDILVYDNEDIWFGTRMGLSIFHKRTETFTNYQHDSSDLTSLSQNSIWNFLRDRSGNIWMGTYAGGLNIYYPRFSNFENIGERIGNKVGLSQSIVNSVLEENNGALWVATDGGGLNYIDRKKGISRCFFPIDKNGRQISHIMTMAKGSKGELYLGTLEGLGIFDDTDGTIDYLPIGTSGDSRTINALLAEENGNLWVGTHKFGVWMIDADGKIETLGSTAGISIQSLYATDEHIWMGTDGSLYCYDKKNKKLLRYREFDNYTVLSLFIDSKKRFWVGTHKGVALFNPRNNEKHFITQETGLVDNMVEAIVEDDSGNIWVSTQNGLSKISYTGQHGHFSDQNLSVDNYTSNNGLSSNRFMRGAVLKSERGELMFGGVNGLTTFYPEKIVRNAYLPPVVVTDFLIDNKSVRVGVENSPLASPIDETKQLTLKYDQNAITFKVAALNYINSSNNQYAYKLVGFDKEDEWYYAGNQRTISYTNLPEGSYILKIKVANNDGVWNEQEKSIAIKVLPPFWKTWWAYTIYISVFLGLLYLFYSYSIKTEKLRH
ncbi:hypothetical protein G5B00_15545 [Parapedobacter sp. SGR-10]|uniref:ligand-binding sensor domain-containing protein n=1 Tax=Parapedobacter sp. SGR-10 TaxID=2710879 RepID=UPI0013D1E101|nr:two-component regulator propeller domain-containing protein [Parapedobacter sp. SGR-10]NGF57933.1 hypothetical protein [Parapedobacter sp. SGR-10]